MSRVFVTLPLPSPGIDMLKERFDVTMMEAEGMPPPTSPSGQQLPPHLRFPFFGRHPLCRNLGLSSPLPPRSQSGGLEGAPIPSLSRESGVATSR